jgi:hypothetical protein
VRSILSGLCLVLSGVVLIFGERRNLHAKALRKEACVVADALAGKGGISSGGSRRRYDARRAG